MKKILSLIARVRSRLRRPWRYWQIYWLIIKLKPRKIMEIGVWTGDRALTMINLAKRYSEAQSIEFYGFDLFGQMTPERFSEEKSKWPSTQKVAYEKLQATGVKIHLFQGDTTVVLPEHIERLPKMDLIFIDGGHSLETIASDWRWSSLLMHDTTVVVFDDYWLGRTDAGSKVTVDGIDSEEYQVTILPLTDSFEKTNFGPLKIKLAKVCRRLRR